MNIRSRKAKGKRLQIQVREYLRKIFTNILEDGDIETTIASEAGVDIKLSPLAKKFIPFDIECKNTESINIWSAITQAEENSIPDRIPMVVFSKNRSKTYCVVEFEKLFNLLYKVEDKQTP